MNQRIPALRAHEIVKALEKANFKVVRQKGSHIFLKHPDGRTTVVPDHQGEDIHRGLLRGILREAQISPQEFLDLLS